jgi:hypothetical protein
MDTEVKVQRECDGNQSQSLCCETLEGGDEDHCAGHTSQNDASRSQRSTKTKQKEEKYTEMDKVFIT